MSLAARQLPQYACHCSSIAFWAEFFIKTAKNLDRKATKPIQIFFQVIARFPRTQIAHKISRTPEKISAIFFVKHKAISTGMRIK